MLQVTNSQVQLRSARASWQDSSYAYSVLLQISSREVHVCVLYGNDGGITSVCAYVFTVAVACYLWESAGQSNRFQATRTHTHTQNIWTTQMQKQRTIHIVTV